jgi:hypothetical protein
VERCRKRTGARVLSAPPSPLNCPKNSLVRANHGGHYCASMHRALFGAFSVNLLSTACAVVSARWHCAVEQPLTRYVLVQLAIALAILCVHFLPKRQAPGAHSHHLAHQPSASVSAFCHDALSPCLSPRLFSLIHCHLVSNSPPSLCATSTPSVLPITRASSLAIFP